MSKTAEFAALLGKHQEEKKNAEEELAKFVSEIPDEEVAAFAKKVSPYNLIGLSLEGKTVSVSVTNMREDYCHKLAVTATIAYMYRSLREYKCPEEVKPVDLEAWKADPKIADTPSFIKDAGIKKKYEEYREWLPIAYEMRDFMNSMFSFDVDRHAVAGYRGNAADASRRVPDSKAVATAVASGNTIRPKAPRAMDAKQYAEAKKVAPSTPLEALAFEVVPPADTFHKLMRYRNEHYEELIQVTNDLYGVRPDMDVAICIYDVHADAAAASKFRTDHMDQFTAPVENIQINRWALLGPYRENRDRVEFLNRSTSILKDMMDKREEDSRLGADIVKKSVKVKKAKSVKEHGPDDAAWVEHMKTNKPDVAALGAEHYGESKDDGMIEVKVTNLSGGGTVSSTDTIYNPVEAPAADTPVAKPSRN